jgi:hypothetical protein
MLLQTVDLSTFKNDSSRYMDIYLMRRKSGSFEIIRKVFKKEVEVIVTRKLCFCNSIAERNIWVTSLANVWWVVKRVFHKLHLPEHHCKWKVREGVIEPFRHGKIKDDINKSAIIPFKSNALETAAFTLKRAPSGLLKWSHGMVRPTMLHLFLTFGIWGLCKRLQTYSKSDKCYFVGYPKSLGISPPQYRGKGFCHKMVCF